MLHKKLCCVNKNIFHIELLLHTKIMWVKKNSLWQQKRLFDTQKNSRWLNMFSVAQKRIAWWQNIVPIVYKCMLHWLKKFWVAQKILLCHTKTKLVCVNVINFTKMARHTRNKQCVAKTFQESKSIYQFFFSWKNISEIRLKIGFVKDMSSGKLV